MSDSTNATKILDVLSIRDIAEATGWSIRTVAHIILSVNGA